MTSEVPDGENRDKLLLDMAKKVNILLFCTICT